MARSQAREPDRIAQTAEPQAANSPTQRPASNTSAENPRELVNALNGLRVETTTYYVKELDVRREGVRMFFTEGKLAFLAPINGRVLGLVFTGRGRVLSLPRDPVEKASLAKFLGAPLLLLMVDWSRPGRRPAQPSSGSGGGSLSAGSASGVTASPS